jgi:predicted Zn-dependent protease
MEKGSAAFTAGDLESARELYEKAAGFSPAAAEPQNVLGRIYAQQGNDGQALLSLKRAVELEPSDIPSRVLLSDLYVRHGKPEAAVEQLRAAMETTEGPADAAIVRRLGSALLRAGRLDEAQAVVERLDSAQPGEVDTLALLAEVLIAQRQEERGLRLLDAAVAAAPDAARVRSVRAKYFASRGKVAEALRDYEAGVRAAPDDVDLSLGRARALAAAGRMGEATAQMEEVVRRRPKDTEVQAGLAEMKLLAGDLSGADQAAQQVLGRHPRNARALYVRARIIETGSSADPVRAINAYREAMDADPGQAEALRHLFRLYLKHGDKTDAMSALEHLHLLGEITDEEELELAALYADTGISAQRGLEIIAEALRREPGSARCLALKQKLEAKAAAMPKRRAPGSGVQILRGGK